MPKSFSSEKTQEWKERILKQRKSGFSVNSWCLQNNISTHTFYYWKDKLYPKNGCKVDLSHTCFTELIDQQGTGITLEYQEIRIHLDKQFDPSTLKQCLKILKEIKC